MMAARHLSFLQLYIEDIDQGRIPADSPYAYDANAYVLAQVGGGYVNVDPETRLLDDGTMDYSLLNANGRLDGYSLFNRCATLLW
jgi:hypothetical protein